MWKHFSKLQHWFWVWMIAVNILRNTMHFAKTMRSIQTPRPVHFFFQKISKGRDIFFREPVQWVKTAQCLEVTLDSQLTLLAHISQVRRKAAQRLGLLGLYYFGEVSSPSEMVCCFVFSSQHMWIMHTPSGGPLLVTMSRNCKYWQFRCLYIATNAPLYIGKSKSKAVLLHAMEALGGKRRYSSYSFTTSALDRGEKSTSRPGCALPPGKGPPVPIVQEAGWAPEPIWTQRL
jgi:hypothetical protein